jgi:hypothetical protein
MSKDTNKEIVLDFATLNKEQFIKNGEEPESSIIAVHPECHEVVSLALDELTAALLIHMPFENIYLMEEVAIQMYDNDQTLELGIYSLFFSLSYPTEAGRTYEMQFGAPPHAVIH